MDFDFLPKLPKSNLDDRTFKDLVEESILRIPRYCPEWTNHNPGDPGITLIELFAWLTDQMLLRFNQVPRRNYVAFLELLGIRLNPPTPAKCPLTFYLTRAQPEFVRIPLGTEVATVRTETEEAIIFTTDRELVIGNPRLKHILTTDIEEDIPQHLRDRTPANSQWHNLDETLLFDQSMPGNCFYLVLCEPENSIEGNAIAITIVGEAARTTGINPDDPPRKWEAWNGRTWQPILRDQDDDKTKGFSFSEIAQPTQGADVVLHLPQAWPETNFGTNYTGHWIRCVYTILHEAQPSYSSSPSIVGLAVRAIGGAVDATQCIRVPEELLGISNGKASQAFELRSQLLVERSKQLREYVQLRLPSGEIEDWIEVKDFAESGSLDRHYTIDSQTGTVQFGPLIREPGQLRQFTQQRKQLQPGNTIVKHSLRETQNQGFSPPVTSENALNERQYGKVPPLGAEIYMVSYRTGGGSRGNVQLGKIAVLKNSIPYVKSVINYESARGGTDAESLDEAVIRVPQMLRTRESAVTPEDFERLAMSAATGAVARAHCLTQPEHTTAGIVRLLLIPNKADINSFDFRRGMKPEEYFALECELKAEIMDYLSARKPLGVQVKLEPPEYVGVSVEIEVILEPQYNNPRDRDLIRNSLLLTLYRFLNPLVGGLEGKGWDYGRTLYPSDIFAVSQQIPGVRYLGTVKLYSLRKFDSEWFRADIPELEIDPGAVGLLASWEDENPQLHSGHRIEFRD
ncbi:putative baseplate assembly protein [Scytonema sp. NUACC26]|uniref:putative baseplate assembly protein n=1 Tax=Scytonema sp. NUACC26 TaxID=3140176 RepID=UPI0034DC907F